MNISWASTANKELSQHQSPQWLQQHLHPLPSRNSVRLLSQREKPKQTQTNANTNTHTWCWAWLTHTADSVCVCVVMQQPGSSSQLAEGRTRDRIIAKLDGAEVQHDNKNTFMSEFIFVDIFRPNHNRQVFPWVWTLLSNVFFSILGFEIWGHRTCQVRI